MFNNQIFERIVTKQYNSFTDFPYTLNDVLCIFNLYLDTYRAYTGREHPFLKPQQVRDIIFKMPFCDDIPIFPEDYPEMIDAYFNAGLHTDYNINHFFSGMVREMRLYERGEL